MGKGGTGRTWRRLWNGPQDDVTQGDRHPPLGPLAEEEHKECAWRHGQEPLGR